MSKVEIICFIGGLVICLSILGVVYWIEWRNNRQSARRPIAAPPRTTPQVNQYSEEEMILGKALQSQARIQEDEYHIRQAMLDEVRNYARYAHRANQRGGRKQADPYE